MAEGRFCLVGPLDQYAVPFKTATVMVPIIALLASVVMGSTGTKDHFVAEVEALGGSDATFTMRDPLRALHRAPIKNHQRKWQLAVPSRQKDYAARSGS